MGFFDGLFNTINNANPISQSFSLAKWLIGGVIILIIFFFIWITVIAKSGMSPAPKNAIAKRMFGVVPKWRL